MKGGNFNEKINLSNSGNSNFRAYCLRTYLFSVLPLVEKDEITSLTKAKPGTDFNGPHYNLNIIGKKLTWSGGGSYNNPDRHTIFVPEDTTGWTIDLEGDYPDLDGIRIRINSTPTSQTKSLSREEVMSNVCASSNRKIVSWLPG